MVKTTDDLTYEVSDIISKYLMISANNRDIYCIEEKTVKDLQFGDFPIWIRGDLDDNSRNSI